MGLTVRLFALTGVNANPPLYLHRGTANYAQRRLGGEVKEHYLDNVVKVLTPIKQGEIVNSFNEACVKNKLNVLNDWKEVVPINTFYEYSNINSDNTLHRVRHPAILSNHILEWLETVNPNRAVTMHCGEFGLWLINNTENSGTKVSESNLWRELLTYQQSITSCIILLVPLKRHCKMSLSIGI